MSELGKPCTNSTPPWFTGHWRDWHRGHGCDRDDGKPRSDEARLEIEQHAANAGTGYLTDAELRFVRAATTSGDVLLCRALDELAVRRGAQKWNTPMRRGLAHCGMGPPGWRCSCGAAFDAYALLAEHVRQSIDCPRCGALPADLVDGDLYRWQCGHWIARGDTGAQLRGADGFDEASADEATIVLVQRAATERARADFLTADELGSLRSSTTPRNNELLARALSELAARRAAEAAA
ncbi:MAG TPA: hypothetical protein VLE97_08725 [Gaiellaceae bacterium]|nr:hypothetical protein [Gaiellaceae bacterium]